MKSLAVLLFLAAAPNPVAWKLADTPAKPLRPGAAFTVRLIAQVQEGWHLYWLKPVPDGPVATRIEAQAGGAFQLSGPVRAPEPEIVQDPNFGMEVGHYGGETVFTLPLRVASAVPSGEHQLTVNATWQSCNDKICLPPRTVKVAAPVAVKR
jgi:DsbC/DsbD-like thiol-disulfide interchange protein